MKDISSLVDQAMSKYRVENPVLSKQLSSSLELRLAFSIDFSKPFKEARREFIRNYLGNLFVVSFGNLSRAAGMASINRRHMHRIVNELNIDVDRYRRELFRPYDYLKENVQQIIESAVESVSEEKTKESIYSHIEDISSLIAENLPSPLTFDEAIEFFEREFISRVLRECSGDIKEAAARLSLSERTLYRKMGRLRMQ